jgi:hypothetical protein
MTEYNIVPIEHGLNIVFLFQGEETYRVNVPRNTKSITFDTKNGDMSSVYNNISVLMPTIQTIEFYEREN